jgi:hypothetical protein
MHIITKLFIIYALFFILVRIRNFKINDIESDTDKDIINNLELNNNIKKEKNTMNNNDGNNKVILYKPTSKNSGYNIKEVFSKIMSRYTNNDKNSDFNIEKFNIFKNNNCSDTNKNINKNNSEKIIYFKKEDNISLDSINNFIINSFQVRKECLYKIKCNLETQGVKNINLIISDSKKRFIYDLVEKNNLDIGTIYDYGFILDNNKFNNDDVINIYLIFYGIEDDKNIIINNIFLEVTEFNQTKDPNAIIIFNVANKYYPLFSENLNILDFEEYNDKNNIFFI